MKLFKEPLTLAGATIAFSLAGKGGEGFPAESFIKAGETTSKFIAPAININMGGYMIKQLKGLKKL